MGQTRIKLVRKKYFFVVIMLLLLFFSNTVISLLLQMPVKYSLPENKGKDM